MSQRGLRLSVRARLTALYAALFGLSGALLLGISYWLVARHFHRTLPDDVADATLSDLRGQYALALVGTLLVAVALGWVIAGRVLRPLAEITATARRVAHDRLDERIALLEELRDDLSECIGCGCLSMASCRLRNPFDQANEEGAGPRYLFGDASPG
jgi:methyl-accepting chemotaxis protein